MDTQIDWRYSDERMKYRQAALKVLFAKFGSLSKDGVPIHSPQSIYECAHDWVSQGNVRPDGIVAYYKAYYDKTKRPDSFGEDGNQTSKEKP